MTLINIVDHRGKKYKFKKVNAIIEPTWHDNACKNADKSENHGVNWIGYDEREHVTVRQAIDWANEHKDHVTLYLYDEDKGICAPAIRGLVDKLRKATESDNE